MFHLILHTGSCSVNTAQSVTGEVTDSSILGGLTQPFGLDQATADPQRFTAAAQVLIAALKAPHPSLLALLLGGSLAEQAADKVSLLQTRTTSSRSSASNTSPGFCEGPFNHTGGPLSCTAAGPAACPTSYTQPPPPAFMSFILSLKYISCHLALLQSCTEACPS